MRCARPEFARWMAHIADHERSPFLEWWFTTSTLVGQCKTDDQGRYPTDPAKIDTARPISRLFVIRRLMAAMFGPLTGKAIRPIIEPHRQYGLSPSGCPAVGLTAALHCGISPNHVHAPLDLANAHSAIRLRAVIETCLAVITRHPEVEIHRVHLIWNLAMYALQ